MDRKLKRATVSWLMLEREGRDPAAERALARLFGALPLPAPSRALLGRTLAELGFDPSVAAGSVPPAHWTFRWAVALALTLSGLAAVLWVPMLVAAFSLKGSANWVVDLGAGFLTAISMRLAAGVTLWEVIARAGATAAEVVATPQVLGLMLATVLFGLATLRVLAGIAVVERSSHHA